MNPTARPPTVRRRIPTVEFLTLLPTIQRHFGYAFRRVPTSLREELLEEALVTAFVMYRRLVDRGCRDRIFASPLARFAALHVLDGRRVGSPQNGHDVCCPIVARRRGFRVEHIDRFNQSAGHWTLLAIPSLATAIPDQVAFRLDFSQWISTQSRRNRRLIQALAYGDTTSEAARRFHLSAARVSQLRLQFAESWRAFQAERQDVPKSAVA
jgi:hypothetical protein